MFEKVQTLFPVKVPEASIYVLNCDLQVNLMAKGERRLALGHWSNSANCIRFQALSSELNEVQD